MIEDYAGERGRTGDAPDVATRAFVAEALRAGRQPGRGVDPHYGSPAWLALPAGDPRRWVAVVRAAECWRQAGLADEIARRLFADLEAGWAAAEEDYVGWRRVALAVRADAEAPSHSELVRRRGE